MPADETPEAVKERLKALAAIDAALNGLYREQPLVRVIGDISGYGVDGHRVMTRIQSMIPLLREIEQRLHADLEKLVRPKDNE